MGRGERLPDQDTQREQERWKEVLGTKTKTVSQGCLTLEPSREILLGEAAKGILLKPHVPAQGRDTSPPPPGQQAEAARPHPRCVRHLPDTLRAF